MSANPCDMQCDTKKFEPRSKARHAGRVFVVTCYCFLKLMRHFSPEKDLPRLGRCFGSEPRIPVGFLFDRRLRLLATDAVERIEVSLRGCLAHHLAMKYGPHGDQSTTFTQVGATV
ncbi:Abi family protein [Agrobacterium rhizogenes]|nr:Abi family protein [Rhizobium rhizogenes]